MRNTQQNTNVFRKLRSSWQNCCKAGLRSVARRLLTLLSRVLVVDLLHLPQVLQVLVHLRSHPNRLHLAPQSPRRGAHPGLNTGSGMGTALG